MSFSLDISGMKQTEASVSGLEARNPKIAARVLNRVARDERVRIARRIRQQVALPASYLAPSGGRLAVVKKAAPNSLTAIIRARARPTSLARFARGRSRRGPVRVEVKPGRLRTVGRGFLIPLRSGNTDTLGNLGLAIRLRPGESVRNRRVEVRRGGRLKGLALLYGPSVQQVFLDRSGRGVAEDEIPAILRHMEHEYFRLLGLT